MDGVQALTVLIEHSTILADDVKQTLKENIPTMSKLDVTAIGIFLAEVKMESIQKQKEQIEAIDTLMQRVRQAEE